MRTKPLVLLVDDEEVFMDIASTKLEAGGLETVKTHSVDEAIKKTEELLPDLVLSDIYMEPDKSGWDFALALRRNPKTREIKFAFFTSLRDPWIETKTNRALLEAELGKIVFLSKMDGVETLAKDVAGLLR